MGFWEPFQVYNRSKHSTNPDMFGTNHSNLGEGKTTYLYSHEYREPSKKKKIVESNTVIGGEQSNDMRKSSVSSDSSQESNMVMMGGENPHMVDISNLSQNEFKRLYESMRKGEPDNKVNF